MPVRTQGCSSQACTKPRVMSVAPSVRGSDTAPRRITSMRPSRVTRATVEGGDILVTGREILVGTSARTNDAGIAALNAITSRWGYTLRRVETPPGVLHFKTDCALLDASTILTTERLAASGCFDGYDLIHTAAGEEAAANVIRFNDTVLMPAGFPATKSSLTAAGYQVTEIPNTECAKLDGGMSCLSLRFTPS